MLRAENTSYWHILWLSQHFLSFRENLTLLDIHCCEHWNIHTCPYERTQTITERCRLHQILRLLRWHQCETPAELHFCTHHQWGWLIVWVRSVADNWRTRWSVWEIDASLSVWSRREGTLALRLRSHSSQAGAHTLSMIKTNDFSAGISVKLCVRWSEVSVRCNSSLCVSWWIPAGWEHDVSLIHTQILAQR